VEIEVSKRGASPSFFLPPSFVKEEGKGDRFIKGIQRGEVETYY